MSNPGAPVNRPTTVLVGEEGPELLVTWPGTLIPFPEDDGD